MPLDQPPLIDAGDIIRLVGQGVFQRGRDYSRTGRVLSTTWDPESLRWHATVQGSKSHTYRTTVTVEPAFGASYTIASSQCTCPMTFDCKHVVAVVLASNSMRAHQALDASRADAGPDSDEWSGSVSATPVAPWKAALSDIVGAPTAPPGATPMALQFELRERIQRSPRSWSGPTAKPATADTSPLAEVRLAVRPVVLGSSGQWIRSNVTWNSVAHLGNRLGLNPAHQSWFAQFAALHRAGREGYAHEPDWISLDDFRSPLFWQLLRDAADLGIALVIGKKAEGVDVGGRAIVSIDARTDAASLVLETVVAIDGHSGEPSGERGAGRGFGAIGDHGVFRWSFEPQLRLELAATSGALSAEQRRVLSQRAPLVVPAADRAEFFADYLPGLRRAIEVASSDGSVELPAILAPELVLTGDFRSDAALVLTWQWQYGEQRVSVNSHGDGTAATSPSAHRDAEAETRLLATVAQALKAGGPVGVHEAFRDRELHGLDAADFVTQLLPVLRSSADVVVETLGEQPDFRELTETPKLTVRTVDTSTRDWFDLGVVVTVEGRDIPFGVLFTALSKGQSRLLLVDKTYLSLKQPVFDELRRLIEEAIELGEWETAMRDGGVRISRYQASLWADFEDLADETEQAVAWREAVAGLLSGVESTALPTGFTAQLRPYQQDGFDWLAFLWRHSLGGILADDMGLGKTVQALALVAHALEQGDGQAKPFLVVAPTSVVSNWVSEAEKFTPGLRVHAVTATKSASGRVIPDDVDLVVTSYALFRLDFEQYRAREWGGLILDEAQFVKNRASKAHRCAVELDAPVKIAITGTPMENSLSDLWSLLAIVAPGLFASHRRFVEDYVRPIAAGAGPELVAKLRRRIRPLMMRRTKELVATELPPKQEQVLHVDLVPRQRALYDAYLQRERQKLLGLIDDLDRNRFIVFRSLTLLRMLSLDAALIDDAYSDIPSAKLDALLDQLADVAALGHRALVFSQFTSFLTRAADRLDAAGIPHEYLDGSTRKRAEVIARFRQGDAPVFLISLKAGGFGLTLTEADYVFVLDPWWNPATEEQAVDRTHRIGQTRSVNVYRLVANGTIEEKVMALKTQKSKLIDAVLDDDGVFSSTLSADDIRGLLEG